MRRGLLGAILGFSSLLLIFVACVRQVPTLEYATLTIQTNEAVTILKGQVHYDPTALTLVGANSLIATAIAEASASEGVVDFGFVSQTAVQEEVLELVFTSTRKGATASLVSLSTVREDESEVPLPLDGARWERGLKQNPSLTAESAELAALALTAKSVLKAEFANTPLGDFNGSSRVNLLDALQLTLALLAKTPLSDYQLYHADISGNGTINSEDIKGIIAKAVNPNLPAILRVAPKQLEINSDTTGLVLIGNAGNKRLPRITTSTNPGNLPVTITNITPQNAVGKVYELKATGSGTGKITFDAKRAGKGEVNVALASTTTPGARIEIKPGAILLTARGETVQLSATVFNPDGTVNPSATVTWQSSNPDVIAVDATGKATAKTDVGSAIIKASYKALSASVLAPVAKLAAGTTLLPEEFVLSAVARANDGLSVTLVRNASTQSLRVGNIVLSSAGLLHKITSLRTEANIVIELELSTLAEAFDAIEINVDSETIELQASVTPTGINVRSTQNIIEPQALSLDKFECKDPTGKLVNFKLNGGSIEFKPQLSLHANYQESGFGESFTFYAQANPRVDFVLPKVTLSAGVSDFKCSLDLSSVKVPLATFFKVITLEGSIAPSLGVVFNGNFNSSVILLPSWKGYGANGKIGFKHSRDGNGSSGFETIHEGSSVKGNYTPFSFELSQGQITASVKPFVEAKLGLGVDICLPIVREFDACPEIPTVEVGKLEVGVPSELSLPVPPNYQRASYSGPSWSASIAAIAELGFEDFKTSWKVIGIKASLPKAKFELFRIFLAQSPQIALSANPTSVKESTTFTATGMQDYIGKRVEFWGAKGSSNTSTRLTTATVSADGIATAKWTPPQGTAGTYKVRALLFSSEGKLPFASNQVAVEVTDEQEYIGTFEYRYSLNYRESTNGIFSDCADPPNFFEGVANVHQTQDAVISVTVSLVANKRNDGGIQFTVNSLESGSTTGSQHYTYTGPNVSIESQQTTDTRAVSGGGTITIDPEGSASVEIGVRFVGTEILSGSSSSCGDTTSDTRTEDSDSTIGLFPQFVQGTLGSNNSFSATVTLKNSDTEKEQITWQITPK